MRTVYVIPWQTVHKRPILAEKRKGGAREICLKRSPDRGWVCFNPPTSHCSTGVDVKGPDPQLFVAIGAFFVIFGSTASDALPPQADNPGNEGKWSIEEGKSPTNGSPQVVAANLAGDTVLILRCKDQITEAAFSTKYNYLGYKSVDVQLQINDQNRIKEAWKASMDGRAAFAPDAVAFIQSLPDNGRVTIRTTRSDGKVKEGNFDLGAVSEVRSKIAHACVWDDTPNEPVGLDWSLGLSVRSSLFGCGKG